MNNLKEVPGEEASLRQYYELPFQGRKLIVDLFLTVYQLDRNEQDMILGIAQGYFKKKMEKRQAARPGRPNLRLVA